MMDRSLPARLAAAISLVALLAPAPRPLLAQAATTTSSSATRPMTWLDVQNMRQVGSPTPSPDGKWLL